MGENSKIEWCDATFNPWIGCQKVSPGCDHCYAEAMMDHRYGKVQWGPHGERKRTSEANWRKPLQWAKAARNSIAMRRQRVFCASLADVFDNQVPPAWRMDLFALIECTPELDWLLLTKRPENIRKMVPLFWQGGLPNVWIGTTCEDQERANKRLPILLAVPAKVHFLSCEPMLTPIDLCEAISSYGGASSDPYGWLSTSDLWVICGGESGKGARLMEAEWARKLRQQCIDADVPFFMKQMTGKKPIPDDLMVRQFPAPPSCNPEGSR